MLIKDLLVCIRNENFFLEKICTILTALCILAIYVFFYFF